MGVAASSHDLLDKSPQTPQLHLGHFPLILISNIIIHVSLLVALIMLVVMMKPITVVVPAPFQHNVNVLIATTDASCAAHGTITITTDTRLWSTTGNEGHGRCGQR